MKNPNSGKIEKKVFICEEKLSTYNCKYCSFQTDLLLFLRAHKSFRNDKSDYSIKKYSCKKCDFTSCSILVLELHKENCTALKKEKVCNRIQDKKQCKCAQCLSYRESYKTEIIFDPIKDFKKTVKSVSFTMNNPNSVKIERKSFTCEEKLSTYNCKQCSFQTDLLLFLRAHKSFRNNKSDFSIKKYTCKKCDFTSCSILVLELHKENCTALKREKVCNRIQDQKQCKCAQCLSYRESYKTEIIFDPIKDFKYGKCSRIALKNYLQDHNYANTATQKIDWFKCNECGYQTEKLYCFIRHQLVHAQRSLDKSDFCLFKTTPKKDVRRHTNLEDIWFLCQHCNYKAREMKILNIHNKVFHGIDVMPPQDTTRDSYACSQCLHKFASKLSLMNHVVRHHAAPLKVNWYKCKQCAYTTKSLSELRDHKMISKMCDLGKK